MTDRFASRPTLGPISVGGDRIDRRTSIEYHAYCSACGSPIGTWQVTEGDAYRTLEDHALRKHGRRRPGPIGAQGGE